MTEAHACHRCGRPGTWRVSEARVEEWTCPSCADILAGEPWLHKLSEAMVRPRWRDGRCPHCGATQEAARETGLVGCPLCYVVFEDEFWRSLGISIGAWTRRESW